VPTSQLFVVFFASSCVALFRFIELGVFGWSKVVGLSARVRLSMGWPRTVYISRCSTGCSGCIFGPSAEVEQTVRQPIADYPPGHCGLSAWDFADCLSPLLLEFHFRFEIVSGLLLGLVGPL
jgi:hypothetical protein